MNLFVYWRSKMNFYDYKTLIIIHCANLGIKVMHERNAHNFPFDLASVEAAPGNK
jgi:hypothetical protein